MTASAPVRSARGDDAPEARAERQPREFFAGINVIRLAAAFGIVWLHWALRLAGDAAHPSQALRTARCARDFAVPFFIITSCFLLSRSLLDANGARRSLGSALARRFRVLVVPGLFWSVVSMVLLGDVRPLLTHRPPGGRLATWPSLIFGWGHLWFLPFLFLASCVLIAAFRAFPRIRRHPHMVAAACALLAFALYAVRGAIPTFGLAQIGLFAT